MRAAILLQVKMVFHVMLLNFVWHFYCARTDVYNILFFVCALILFEHKHINNIWVTTIFQSLIHPFVAARLAFTLCRIFVRRICINGLVGKVATRSLEIRIIGWSSLRNFGGPSNGQCTFNFALETQSFLEGHCLDFAYMNGSS